jgi:hypothetical protein
MREHRKTGRLPANADRRRHATATGLLFFAGERRQGFLL